MILWWRKATRRPLQHITPLSGEYRQELFSGNGIRVFRGNGGAWVLPGRRCGSCIVMAFPWVVLMWIMICCHSQCMTGTLSWACWDIPLSALLAEAFLMTGLYTIWMLNLSQ